MINVEKDLFTLFVKKAGDLYDYHSDVLKTYIAEQTALGIPIKDIFTRLEQDRISRSGIYAQLDGAIDKELQRSLNLTFQGESNNFEEQGLYVWQLDPSAEHCDSCLYQESRGELPLNDFPVPGNQETNGETNCEIYCFTADNLVDARKIEKAYRSEYIGELCTLTTLRGQRITGTPNHPILTPNGFIPLKFLNDGDEVLCCDLGDGIVSTDPDINYIPSTIEQIFNSLSLVGNSQRRVGTVPDFYGDGRKDGEIEIVSFKGKLRNDTNLEFCEHRDKNSFINRLLRERFLKGDSFFDEMGISRTSSSQRHISGMSKLSPVFNVKSFHSERSRVTLATLVDSVHSKNPTNNMPCAVETPSDILDRFTGNKTLDNFGVGQNMSSSSKFSNRVYVDRVVSNDRRNTDIIHVYTFQTVSGIYNINGIIASNCKCTLVKVE